MPFIDLDPPDLDDPRPTLRKSAAVTYWDPAASPNSVIPNLLAHYFDPLGMHPVRAEPMVETPGWEDIEYGSDAPTERPAWSSTMSWGETAADLALTAVSPVVGVAKQLTRASEDPAAQAAFRQGNTVASFFADEERGAPTDKEDGFNPWEIIKGTPYEQHWQSFVNVHNSRHAEIVKAKIDRENEDRKIIDSLPWHQALPLQMTAGGLDWPSLLPGGAFVRGAQGGISVMRSAFNVARAGGVATSAQEFALHGSQETRTRMESMANIGASVLLSGMLGAGGVRVFG